MKEFSKHWKASKKPKKQRKYLANAPLNIRREFLSVNLTGELRKKHKTRNLSVRKDDMVKVMRGKFKGKKGKVLTVDPKELKVEVEGLQVQKKDGSKVNVNMRPSNLQITELNEDDKKRIQTQSSSEKTSDKKPEKKNQVKSKKNKESKTKSQSKNKENK